MVRRVGIVACVLGVLAMVVACSGPSTDDFSSLQTKVNELEATVSSLQTKVDTASQTANTAKTDAAAAKTEATNANNAVKQVQGKVATVETRLENYINPPLTLELVSLTTPIEPGKTAKLVMKTWPGAVCSITLNYPADQELPRGLGEKKADRNGEVSWSFRVAKTVAPGAYGIEVLAMADDKTTKATTNLVVVAPPAEEEEAEQ
ncbi:MAG: Lpp/OprI family alanine-zipper lipoprotein [Candidatus Bipolaricaulota bacterium]